MKENGEKRVYLDYAASTPVSEGVLKAMKPYFSGPPAGGFGNAESVHSFGREAHKAVDGARETVAGALGCPPAGGFREIIFTGSATEANNLALRGVVAGIEGKNIVISSIEHSSIYETAAALESEGVEVRLARPDRNGVVSAEAVGKLLDGNTLLVSVMHGNNEIGSIQPIAEIGEMIRKFKAESLKLKAVSYPYFHTDAAQSYMYLGLRPREMNIDLATLSGHKMYGPKGAAVLFIREGVKLVPQMTGGGHERGFRAGTLNVPAVVGFAQAVKDAERKRTERTEAAKGLKRHFLGLLEKSGVWAEANGVMENSLPHILNVHFPSAGWRRRAEELVVALDMRGIAVSSGSACASWAQEASRTVREVYGDEERARRSVRFSFGENTGKSEVEWALKALLEVIHGLSTKPR